MKSLPLLSQKLILIPMIIMSLILSSCNTREIEDGITKDESITIEVMAFGNASLEARNRVSAALSKITQEKIGCNVNLTFFNFKVYENEFGKKQLEGESPDVFCVFEQDMLSSLVKSNQLLELDYYREKYNTNFSVYLNEDDWNSMRINNRIYAVPTTMNDEYSLGAFMRKDIVEQLGIDVNRIRNLDDLEKVLIRVRDETNLTPLITHFGDVIAPLGEDPLGDSLGVLLDMSSGDTIVENFYASQKYYDFTKRMYKWYGEGLIMKNAVSNEEASVDLISSDIGFSYLHRYKAGVLKSSQGRAGYDLTVAQLSDLYLSTDTNNLGWGISTDSKYPDEAMAFINLLYTNSEAMNLCAYGMEGFEYKVVSENVITKLDTTTEDQWSSIGWSWPNFRIAATYQTESGSLIEFEKLQGAIHVSTAYGFVFDSSTVQTEVDSCKAIVDKYHKPLVIGMLNPDDTIPLFLEELRDAGVDVIIEEKQRQLDRFISVHK